jgi:hypothetical protein
MRSLRTTLAALMLSAAALPVLAADLAGHWEGIAASATGMQGVSLDVARAPDRSLRGTVSTDTIKGLPLASVSQEDDVVTFALAGQLGVSFQGRLEKDGQTLAGFVSTPEGDATLTLERKGEARFEPPPVSARIDPRMEGAWEGALDAGGRHLRVLVKLANGQDGTASGTLASLDEGVETPVAIVQEGAKLKLEVGGIGGTYEAVLDAAGQELAGTYVTRGMDFPLILRRVR